MHVTFGSQLYSKIHRGGESLPFALIVPSRVEWRHYLESIVFTSHARLYGNLGGPRGKVGDHLCQGAPNYSGPAIRRSEDSDTGGHFLTEIPSQKLILSESTNYEHRLDGTFR